MIEAVFECGVVAVAELVVAFIGGVSCAFGDECELTIVFCIENVGAVSAKAELIVCTVLSAIAECVGTGVVVIDVECVSVRKREPTVTVGTVCKGANCSAARMKVELAGCCRLASETLRSSAACDESNCDKEL